jgi:hypothetical protein
MANVAGTFEHLAGEMARVFVPLVRQLETDSVDSILGWVGLRWPDSTAGTDDLLDALTAGASAAAGLVESIPKLARAIDAEDEIALASVSLSMLQQIAAVVRAANDAADALQDLSTAATDLTAAQQAELKAVAEVFVERLLDRLLVEYIEKRFPQLALALIATGGIEISRMPGGPAGSLQGAYTRKVFSFDRMVRLLTDPAGLLEEVYGWGQPGFDGVALFNTLQTLLALKFEIPAQILQPPGSPPLLEAFAFNAEVNNTVSPPGLDVSLRFPAAISRPASIRADDWQIDFDLEVAFAADLMATLRPLFDLAVDIPTGTADFHLSADVARSGTADPLLLFGDARGSRLEMNQPGVGVELDLHFDPATGIIAIEPSVRGALGGGKLVIDSSGGGGVLSGLLSNLRIDAPFDLSFSWNPTTGIRFEGNAALDIRHPVTLTLGPLTVQTVYVRVGLDGSGQIPIELSGALSLALGPLLVTVDRLGLTATLSLPDGGGNLGPLNLDISFKPPSGIGLLVDAPAISGGGVLSIDPGPPERYAGTLSLKLTNFGVFAFGMFERTSTGRIAFVMVLGIRFFPGLQLGFGFAITGVGGIVALNRRVDADALRSRLVSGGASNVLFCEDPVRNAPALFGDLGAIFPVADGIFTVGPTFQIGWLVFVRFDLGIVIELPGPSKIILLGSARFQVGGEAGRPAVVQIRLDILGVIDFARKLVSFDAMLINSKLLQVFTLTGTSAFRLSTGDSPYALLTIGGFHPSFNPEPVVIPPQERVALTYDTGGSTRLWVRLETYLAITTNTFQLGAALEAGVEIGPMNANGYLGFDALIQFTPFAFDVTFSAGFRIRYKSLTLAGVTFNGSLTGPGPIVLSGTLCIEILFFDICFSATFSLGEPAPSALQPISSLVQTLQTELDNPANLEAIGAEDRQVALASGATTVKTVIMPQGRLQWQQTRAPLNTLIERVAGVPLASAQAAIVTSPAQAGVVQDWFSPGTFQNLTESEAMNLPPFQQLASGIQLGFALAQSGTLSHPVEFETIRLPEPVPFTLALLLPPLLLRDAASLRREPGRMPEAAPAVGVRDETWSVRDGGATVNGLSPADAHMRARGTAAMALPALDASDALDLGGL